MTTPAPQPQPRILVVDDTIANLRLLTELLGNRGYDVRPVTSGKLALAAAETAALDLVLLDITMPEMDGYEVCRALKASESTREVPVIFLTAQTETSEKVRAFGVGGVDYITKPFQFEEVLARVETHLALRKARRDVVDSLERLREAENLRDKLSHMIVHDMRNLLMVVAGYLDMARMASGNADQVASDIVQARRATDTVTRMTEDLLDLGRLESGDMPIRRDNADLAAIAREITTAVGVVDGSYDMIVTELGSARANCDAELVRRVMHNILANAVKYAPEGSRIEVTLEQVNGEVRVAVDDEGPGVPEELGQRVFEKFVTGASGSRTKYHSAGIGLAFCKLAVEAHGGAIGVEAREPCGSRFWFTIPASVA